jgi:pyridoxine 4-dehydrogenase
VTHTDAGTGPDPGSSAGSGPGWLAGRPVRRVGYGARQLALQAPGRDAAVELLRRAVELGVDHVDTADFYGAGVAGDLIRAALHPYPDGLALVSKVGVRHDEHHGLVPAQRPEELRAGVEANLRRLGTERLAAVNLRRVDTGPRLIATGDQQVDIDSQLAELVVMRDEGKIGGIGLSNVNLRQLRRALPAGIVCVQNVYNLVERFYEPVFEECRRHDIAWVPFFPMGSPESSTRVSEHPAVIEVASVLGASPTQIGLAWLLAHDPRILLIPGTADLGHLEENVAAADVELDARTKSTLDAAVPVPVPPAGPAVET